MKFFDKKILTIGIVGGVGLYLLRRQAKQAAKVVGAGVDPTSRNNWFYRGVNAVGDVVDDGGDNDSFTLGGAVYDLFNDDSEYTQ